MNCHECMEQLELALDDRLDEQTNRAFLDHLESCPACRQEYEEMLALLSLVRHLPEMDVPEGFRESWVNALDEEAGGVHTKASGGTVLNGIFGNRRLQIFTVAAAALVIGVVGPSVLARNPLNMAQEDAMMSAEAEPGAGDMGLLNEPDMGVLEEPEDFREQPEDALVDPPDTDMGIMGMRETAQVVLMAEDATAGLEELESFLEEWAVKIDVNEREAVVFMSADDVVLLLDWLEDQQYGFRRDRETLEADIRQTADLEQVEIRMVIQN